MAIRFTEAHTPEGSLHCRLEIRDTFTADDARAFVDLFSPGGAFHRWPLIGVTLEMTSVPPDTRQVLRKLSQELIPVTAVVITSLPMRVVVQFMAKLIGHPTVEMFETEAQALAFLDATIPKTPNLPKRIRTDVLRANG